jgi:eukaryotic-like serine/threonine-protein kinase
MMERERIPGVARIGWLYRLVRTAAILTGLLALAAFSGAMAMYFAMEEDRVEVPRVVGMESVAAGALVREAGLTPRVVAEEFSATIPKGHVTSQRPARGTRLKIGAEVRLLLSRGSDQLTVPQLGGLPMAQAKRQLAESGLALGPVTAIHSDAVPREAVIAHDPPAGASAVRGAPVRFLQSLGPREDLISMPDVREREMVVALNLLKELQLEARVSFSQAASRQGHVVAQDPAPGTPVKVGAQVQIVVGE